MGPPDPAEGVLSDLQEAISAEVDAQVAKRIFHDRVERYVLYAIVMVVVVVAAVVVTVEIRRNQQLAQANRAAIQRINRLLPLPLVTEKQCMRVQELRDEVNQIVGTLYRDGHRNVFFSPATNCEAVALHPVTYRRPPSLPYGEALRRGLAP